MGRSQELQSHRYCHTGLESAEPPTPTPPTPALRALMQQIDSLTSAAPLLLPTSSSYNAIADRELMAPTVCFTGYAGWNNG